MSGPRLSMAPRSGEVVTIAGFAAQLFFPVPTPSLPQSHGIAALATSKSPIVLSDAPNSRALPEPVPAQQRVAPPLLDLAGQSPGVLILLLLLVELALLRHDKDFRSNRTEDMVTPYKPKNILITGAAGFIASHVTIRIIKNYPDYKIVVLDKLDYCSNLKNLLPVCSSPNFKFVKGDIASADLVNFLIVTENIDTIMHFAAQTHVDNSFGNSFEFTMNNVYGTHVLLEACKVTGQIRRFIHVSTDEVYGETDVDAVVGNHEAAQLLPTNPYAATKAGAEMLVMAYGRSYGLPVITTRGNNVYGPNQFPEKLIPKLILLAMRGKPLPIYGDGSNVRSFLYCEDVAEAFEVILHHGEVGHVYNIGTKRERTVLDVAKDVCNHFNLEAEKAIQFVVDRPFNDKRYFLDDAKLKSLGWVERTPWQEGLRKTIEWYVANSDFWGDVSGALVPHPRTSMMPSYGGSEEIKGTLSEFMIHN